MAATWIKPIHAKSKGKSIAHTIDYVENPDKTRHGELVTGYKCNIQIVDAEFLLSKDEYSEQARYKEIKNDILAYHIRQSFKPGEITPELANKLGRELAMRFTKNNHAFIVATHIDKKHIHNHIIFNSMVICKGGYEDSPTLHNRQSAHLRHKLGVSATKRGGDK